MKNSKRFFALYLKFRKSEYLTHLIKILGFSITCFTIYLLFFIENMSDILLGKAIGNNTEQIQFLSMSTNILNIFLVVCIFILTYACIDFSHFHYIKNNRRFQILRALGIRREQELMFECVDICLLSIISTILSNIFAFYILKDILCRFVFNNISPEFVNIIMNFENSSYIFLILKMIFLTVSIQLLSLYINFYSKNTSIWKNLREQEERKELSIPQKVIVFLWFLYNVLIFSNNVSVGIIGSFVLLFVVWIIFSFVKSIFGIFLTIFSKTHSYHIHRLTIKVMKKRMRKNSIFLTIICISILLLYTIMNIEWGLEKILETYWEKTHAYNIGILADKSKDKDIQEDLEKEKIPYVKLYAKIFEEERHLFAVSNVTDSTKPFYVEKGTLRTVNYNLYRYHLKRGEQVVVNDKQLTIGKPLKEYVFLLMSYDTLGNYEDFSDIIDDSYKTIFFILSKDHTMFQNVKNIAKNNGSKFLDSKRMMKRIQVVFKDYIDLIKVIFVILVCLIFVFVVISSILSITLRKKEIFTYWTVGGSISQIKQVILLEYFYLSMIVVAVSSITFMILLNMFQLVCLNNTAFYHLPLGMMSLGTLFTLFLIMGTVFLVLTNFCRKKSYVMTREE